MFPQRRAPPKRESDEGCRIKVKRDQSGRVKEISTNGKCSKTDLEIFKEQNGVLDKE